MRHPLLVAIIVIMALILLSPSLTSQDIGEGEVIISSDVEMLGVSDLSGGGHITWQLSGAQASLLRQKILWMFDEYPQIPPGFAYALTNIGGTRNGVIDSIEALSYTSLLELEVEGYRRNFTGMDLRYLRVDRADLLNKDLPVDKNTVGLVGYEVNSTDNVEIRFLFNSRSTVRDGDFLLQERGLADALHQVFEFHARQELRYGLLNSAWPLQLEGGWHMVNLPDGPALWMGNSTYDSDPLNGRYLNKSSNATRALLSTLTPWIDLRFASSAKISLDYMGAVSDQRDRLVLQIADNLPALDEWGNLTDEDGYSVFPDTRLGEWRHSSFDLSAHIGKKIGARLLFTSDETWNDMPGYFVRNFTVDAPSRYRGVIELRASDYLVGALSFKNFRQNYGQSHLIRTPGGELLFYSATFNDSIDDLDRAAFSTFDFPENPQILFVGIIASAYFTSKLQSSIYEGFRDDPAFASLGKIRRVRWIHWLSRVFILSIIIFYFLPSLFVVGNVNFYFSGLALWAYMIVAPIALLVATRYLYAVRLRRMMPEVGIEEMLVEEEPEAVERLAGQPRKTSRPSVCAKCRNVVEDARNLFTCECSEIYHRICASSSKSCVSCARPIVIERPQIKALVTVKCPHCSEVQLVEEGLSLIAVRCQHCQKPMEELEKGKSYLLLGERTHAYELLRIAKIGGRLCLLVTTEFPEKAMSEHDLVVGDAIWLTETTEDQRRQDPRRFSSEGVGRVAKFFGQREGSAVLLDGFEYLSAEMGFEEALRGLKRILDFNSVHEGIFIVVVAPSSFSIEEMNKLKVEFDKVAEIP